MDTIPYFDSLYLENRLIDSFDFVGGGSVYQYSGHGTSVSSTIIAEMAGSGPDAYAGTAKDVDIALYVSEDISSETQLEEFNLVAALERCDSMGVDIANISLGYFGFDDSLTDYTYADLDGQTTISAIGVTVAASRGIIVVTSAGNSGPDHITTPADADSVLTVGAIEGFGNYAWFSGVGPSFDGRVKPDVVARGGAAWFIRSDGTLDDGNGTSFSSPIMAGAVACLVEANPLKTAQEIIQSVRESASQFSTPDTLTGYGIPDFCQPFVAISEIDAAENSFYPLPADDYLIVESSLLTSESTVTVKLVDLEGRTIQSSKMNVVVDQIQIDTKLIKDGAYVLLIEDARHQQILKQKILVKH
jgi:subtilisin family serine protease